MTIGTQTSMTRSAFALACLVTALPAAISSAAPQPVVFAGVTVIDGRGGLPLPNRNVVIKDGLIVRIEDASKAQPAKGDEVIQGLGRFLIPGLWNMHVHSISYDSAISAFPALLASGITGVRDMGAPLEEVLRLRREIDAGSLLGPHMIVAGPLLQGPLPPQLARLPLLRSLRSPEEAAATVRALREAGVDFIKIGDTLPPDLFDAVAAEAGRLGMPFAGHVPLAVGVVAASEAGQRSIEHLGPKYAVLLACSRREAELGERLRGIVDGVVAAAFRGEEPDEAPLMKSALTSVLVDSYEENKAQALFQRFVRNGTWHVPTLVALRGLWKRSDLSRDDVRDGNRIAATEQRIVGSMSRAGVKLMAGSDGPIGSASAGLQEELELLVQSGLTPQEALQTATRNPTEFLGQLESLGTIEPGKVADLVLLDANPIEDIGNVRKIALVMLAGKVIRRSGGSK